MEGKHQIILRDWDFTCGDGCCYDYGTELIVNGEVLTKYFDSNNGDYIEQLQAIFDKIGANVEINKEHDYE